MINAPPHQMAKWLTEVLQPVLHRYSKFLLKDIFEFCERIQEFSERHDCSSVFMCSFDVTSLFTNMPLNETLQICLDALYRDEQIPKPTVPENLSKKMLLKATTDVEFSFNNKIYKQVDGVAGFSSWISSRQHLCRVSRGRYIREGTTSAVRLLCG